MRKFKTAIENGRHFIVAPNGVPVLEYTFCNIGRGEIEYSVWCPQQRQVWVAVANRGLTRAILQYLNTGTWDKKWADDLSHWLYPAGPEILKNLRERHKWQ